VLIKAEQGRCAASFDQPLADQSFRTPKIEDGSSANGGKKRRETANAFLQLALAGLDAGDLEPTVPAHAASQDRM
jgi:hypothetical protein